METKEAAIERIKNEIRNNPDWLKYVKEQATKKGITEEQSIQANAEYQYLVLQKKAEADALAAEQEKQASPAPGKSPAKNNNTIIIVAVLIVVIIAGVILYKKFAKHGKK